MPRKGFGRGLGRVVRAVASFVNLLTNGDFSSGTAGWVLNTVYGTGSMSVVAGQMVVTGGPILVQQSISTAIGTTYTVTGQVIGTTGSPAFIRVRKSDDANVTASIMDFTSGVGSFSSSFTATATTSWITMQVNDAGATMTVDNLVVHT